MVWVRRRGADEYNTHVWLLLSRILCFVSEGLDVRERMAWTVEMERGVVLRVVKVRKGLPLTRKKRRFGGMSKVRLRSLKEEMTCLEEEEEDEGVEMVRSDVKVW